MFAAFLFTIKLFAMHNKEKQVSIAGIIASLLACMNAAVLKVAYIDNPSWYWCLPVTLPLLLFAILSAVHKKDIGTGSKKLKEVKKNHYWLN